MPNLFRTLLIALSLAFAAAAPVAAQEVSAQDRATVAARFETQKDKVVAGDMSAAMDMLPPGVIESPPRNRVRWYRSTGSTADSSLAAVIRPTVTRVRRNTASITAP